MSTNKGHSKLEDPDHVSPPSAGTFFLYHRASPVPISVQLQTRFVGIRIDKTPNVSLFLIASAASLSLVRPNIDGAEGANGSGSS